MFAKPIVLTVATLLAVGSANAQVGVTADIGTTGVGAHVVVPMTPQLNARFGANYIKHDFDKTSDGVDYNLKGKLQTFDVLVDWYLSEGGSFHLTGGAVYNGNKFDVRGKPNGAGTFNINGNLYTASDVGLLTGRIDFRKAAPYLGIGWGNAVAQAGGWNVTTDLGVFYQGSPNVQLAVTGCTVSSTVCNRLAQDVEAARQTLGDDTSSFKIYPVARVGIGYRF
jgi:hypothetical protein